MKTLSLAVITVLAVSAPAFAQDAPKTKADCDKAKGSWDEKTMTCTVKK